MEEPIFKTRLSASSASLLSTVLCGALGLAPAVQAAGPARSTPASARPALCVSPCPRFSCKTCPKGKESGDLSTLTLSAILGLYDYC